MKSWVLPLLLIGAFCTPHPPAYASPKALPYPCTLRLYIPDCNPSDPDAFPQTQRPQVGGDCYGEALGLDGLSLLDAEGEPTGSLFEDLGRACGGLPAYTLETTLFPDTYTLRYEEGADVAELTFEVKQPRVDGEIPYGCGCSGMGEEGGLSLWALMAIAVAARGRRARGGLSRP